jgi:hypothetical protein
LLPRQGNFTEVHQAPLPTSKYHASLDSETDDQNKEGIDPRLNTQIKAKTNIAADSRYWSDYSRVYYNARSFQRLPTSITSDWNAAANDWGAGKEVFRRYDAVRVSSFRVGVGGGRSSVQIFVQTSVDGVAQSTMDGSMAEDAGAKFGNMVLTSSPSTGYGAHGRLTPGVRRRVRPSAGQHVYSALSFLSFSNLMIFGRFYRVSN